MFQTLGTFIPKFEVDVLLFVYLSQKEKKAITVFHTD